MFALISREMLNSVGWGVAKEWYDIAPWGRDRKRAEDAYRRGNLFTPDELKTVLALWAGALEGQPLHEVDCLTIPTRGGDIQIGPGKIGLPDEATGDVLQASMAHIASQWGGGAVIPLDLDTLRDERIQTRAYGRALGIEVLDCNDASPELVLTPPELAKIAEMADVIREASRQATSEQPSRPAGGPRRRTVVDKPIGPPAPR